MYSASFRHIVKSVLHRYLAIVRVWPVHGVLSDANLVHRITEMFPKMVGLIVCFTKVSHPHHASAPELDTMYRKAFSMCQQQYKDKSAHGANFN